jgi:hypothetical protein
MEKQIEIEHWAAKGLGKLVEDENGRWYMDWFGRHIEVNPADGVTITVEDILRDVCDRHGFRPPRVVYLEEKS